MTVSFLLGLPALGALLHPRLPRLARVEPTVDRRLQSGLLSVLVGAALTASPLPAFAEESTTVVRVPTDAAGAAPALDTTTPERTPEIAALEQALQRAKAENDYLRSITQKQVQESTQLQSKAATLDSEEQARISELTRVRDEMADKATLAQKQADQLKQAETKLEAAQASQRASSAALARVQADTPPQDTSWLLPLGLGGVVVVQGVAIFKVLQEKQALEEQLSGRR
tara:strand:+ start:131 stop:814 length:684 start_codon:yes stop_codon:yes gene_type:complete